MDDERRPDEAQVDDPGEPEAAPPADAASPPDAARPADATPPAEPAPADAPEEATSEPATPSDQPPPDQQPDAVPPPDATPELPPLVDWNAPPTPPTAWDAAIAAASTSRIDIGSLFGRTLDTFLVGWRTFAVLGIVPAIVGVLVQFLAYGATSYSNVWLFLLLSIGASLVYLVVLLAMVVAADDIRAGRPASVVSALQRGLSRTGSAIVSAILFILVYLGIAILIFVPISIMIGLLAIAPARGAGANPSMGLAGILFAVLFIAGFALILYVLLRLSMFIAPITLDRAGPVEGLRISWRVVKGHLWRLGILFVALYLLIAPLAFAAGFLFIASRPIGAVLSILVGIVTVPILAIALSLAYGDLTNRPRAEDAVRSPRRTIFAVVVFVAGILLIVPSVALAIPRLGELAVAAIPPEDRGKLYFGTERNPVSPCAPLGRSTTFSTTDPIYIGGYFSQSLLPGQSASIHVYVDDNEIVNSPIQAGAQAVACYYEPTPLEGAPPGEYRIVIEDGTTLYAEGTFTVQ